MIYFDNAATTLIKPQAVTEAVEVALKTFGNPGRSFIGPSMLAARAVYSAREEIARLTGLDDPLNVAFTSSATESLNLVTDALLEPGDRVVTDVYSHNSVLRPLYRMGCEVIAAGEAGEIELEDILRTRPKALYLSHGSNLTGRVADAPSIYEKCLEYDVAFVLDAAQTMGSIPVKAGHADIICFTGHKGLFGPQGTGGVIIGRKSKLKLKVHKTGGTGSNSFSMYQNPDMPELFEAGTLNSHGLNGLAAAVKFINGIGINTINKKEIQLTNMFLEGVADLPGVVIYGDFHNNFNNDYNHISRQYAARLPIVSINLADMDSGELAGKLWNDHEIAVRSGAHCAPLAHRAFGTESRGMARFSFSFFNTEAEILAGIEAIRAYAAREK